MRRVFVGRTGHHESATALRMAFYRVHGFEHDCTQQMVRVLACIGDNLGGFEPVPNTHWQVTLDYREQIPEERKACQLSTVSTGVVKPPIRFGSVAVCWVKKGLNDRMVQSDATIKERDEPRICGVWLLKQVA